jgi:hypothetical protein
MNRTDQARLEFLDGIDPTSLPRATWMDRNGARLGLALCAASTTATSSGLVALGLWAFGLVTW